MNSTAIECLPPEMMCEIFKNLNLDQLIVCKLVSKRWYLIISQLVKVNRLVLNGYNHNNYYDLDKFDKARWFHSNKPVNIDLECCKFNSFLTHYNKNISSNLKHLMIECIWMIGYGLPSSFDLNQLNLFTQLIQLEINMEIKFESKKPKILNLHLDLPNLEVLDLNYDLIDSESSLSLECPKLKVFGDPFFLNDDNEYNIKYPETITKLYSANNETYFNRFKNVEYLKCYSFDLINEKTLRVFRNLKEIDCRSEIGCIFESIENVLANEENDNNLGDDNLSDDSMSEEEFIERLIFKLKLILKNIFKSAKKLRMSNLKLYIAGLQVTEDNIGGIDFCFESNKNNHQKVDQIHFYAVNYRYLKDYVPSFTRVNYNRFLNLFDPIPRDFFTKFFAINEVNATGSIDQLHFQLFLKNLNCLRLLHLKETNLNQSFYDELPEFCSLIRFQLDEKEYQQLNFEFITKFIKLRFFYLNNQKISLNSAKSLIGTFRSLTSFCYLKSKFNCRGRSYEIKKESERCEFYILTKQGFRSISLDTLIRHFSIII